MNNFRKNNYHSKAPLKQRGVGLIEVLVSVLVLGVGALGVASMQLTGLKFNAGSQGRTQAIFLATDMMDRMRANRSLALDSDEYEIEDLSSVADVTAPGVDCYSENCTPIQLAEFDRFYFLQQVDNLVPFGQGQITFDTSATTGDRFYNITIQWRDVAGRQDREGLTIDDTNNFDTFTFTSTL